MHSLNVSIAGKADPPVKGSIHAKLTGRDSIQALYKGLSFGHNGIALWIMAQD